MVRIRVEGTHVSSNNVLFVAAKKSSGGDRERVGEA